MVVGLTKTAGITFVLSVLGVSGCSQEHPPQPAEFEVRDSAGVEIIETGPTTGRSGHRWHIEVEPVLQIGGLDGTDPYLFEWLSDALRVPDGRIVIAEGRTQEVRVFRPNGQHELTFGGNGGGPREFGARPILALIEPDTLVIYDPGHHRLSRFDLEGVLLEQLSVASTVTSLPIDVGANTWSLAPDGFLLWTGPPRGQPLEGKRRFTLLNAETKESFDFGVFDAGRSVRVPNRPIYISDPFAPGVWGTLGPPPNRVAISAPEKWELRFFDEDGTLVRILRARIPRVAVTDEVQGARREFLIERVTRFRAPAGEGVRIHKDLPLPDSLPAIGSLIWDRANHLWVGRRGVDPAVVEEYDVFDLDGRWIHRVRVPQELGYLLEIGEDYVLAGWRDEFDVPYLRVYRLTKPGM